MLNKHLLPSTARSRIEVPESSTHFTYELKRASKEASILSLDSEDDVVKLQSNDGITEEVNSAAARMSKLVATFLDYEQARIKFRIGRTPAATVVKVSEVAGDVLQLVCQYLRYHSFTNVKGLKQEAQVLRGHLRSALIEDAVSDSQDACFINSLAMRDLHRVVLAANYMGITPLLHLACAKLATLVKGRPISDVKDLLNRSDLGFRRTRVHISTTCTTASNDCPIVKKQFSTNKN